MKKLIEAMERLAAATGTAAATMQQWAYAQQSPDWQDEEEEDEEEEYGIYSPGYAAVTFPQLLDMVERSWRRDAALSLHAQDDGRVLVEFDDEDDANEYSSHGFLHPDAARLHNQLMGAPTPPRDVHAYLAAARALWDQELVRPRYERLDALLKKSSASH